MTVEGTTERVLRLLALLQRRTSWTAGELAEELRVTDRSVRRDVERLRTLGYPVEATSGVGGGYRLGPGTRLPPLLLDDEEAIATAVSLRLAAGETVTGAADAAVRVLAKLDQVMPPRLRGPVRAVHESTETLVSPGIQVDPEALLTFARACRDRVRVRFDYSTGDRHSERTVEPVRMVATGRRWYLMAWDIDRGDWRTFRLDRMHRVSATGWQFRPRDHPDPVEYVQQAVSQRPYRFLARVRVHTEADRLRELIPPQVGVVEPDRDGWSLLTAGGDDLEWMAMHLARLDLEQQILEPAELRTAAATLAGRLAALSRPATGNVVTSVDVDPTDPDGSAALA
jgi:predicted DNA-binding transcriptional regulator YafY